MITVAYEIGDNEAGSIKIKQIPLRFNYTGRYYYSNGNLPQETSYGYYWSSTAYSSTRAYYLNFYSGSVRTSNLIVDRGDGYALRCVAR